MVPRDKMAALELNTPPDKVLEAVRSGAHTRMPVYEGTPDNIVGIVNTKDLFYLFSLQGIVVLEDAMYPALFLKPEENLANALRLFRKSHRPMALVRDEEGARSWPDHAGRRAGRDRRRHRGRARSPHAQVAAAQTTRRCRGQERAAADGVAGQKSHPGRSAAFGLGPGRILTARPFLPSPPKGMRDEG